MIYVAYVHAMQNLRDKTTPTNKLEPDYEFYSNKCAKPLSDRGPRVIKYTKGCRFLKEHKKQIFFTWFFISLLIFVLLLNYFKNLGVAIVLGVIAAMIVRCIVIWLFLLGWNG